MFRIYDIKNYKSVSLEQQLILIKYLFGFIPTFNNKISKKCKNTLRNDSNPDCYFIVIGDKIKFYDFANQDYWNKSIFDLIRKEYNLEYYDSLNKISDILNNNSSILAKIKPLELEEVTKSILKIVTINYTDEAIEYWNDLGVNIKKYKKYIKQIKEYYVESNEEIIKKECNNITFAYVFPNENMKIYSPNEHKKNKFRSSCTHEDIFGLDFNLKQNYVIITKSFKDCIVLNELGYDSVALQSEVQYHLPNNLIEFLKSKKKVFILYDNDDPGVNGALSLKQNLEDNHNIYSETTTYPIIIKNKSIKDTSDFYRKYGREYIRSFIESFI